MPRPRRYARQLPRLKHFIYFSTDEVYGSAAEGQAFKEGERTRLALTTRTPQMINA